MKLVTYLTQDRAPQVDYVEDRPSRTYCHPKRWWLTDLKETRGI